MYINEIKYYQQAMASYYLSYFYQEDCVYTRVYFIQREREGGEREVDFENFPSASNLGQTTSGQRFSNFFTYPI